MAKTSITKEEYEEMLHALKDAAVKIKAAVHLLYGPDGAIAILNHAFDKLHNINNNSNGGWKMDEEQKTPETAPEATPEATPAEQPAQPETPAEQPADAPEAPKEETA